MAEDKAKENELQLDGAGKKKKMIIIIAIVVILVAGGGGAYFFMGGESAPEQVQSSEDSDESGDNEGGEGDGADTGATVGTGSAVYVPLPRPFRFNVPGAARDRFVEIRVQLLVRGAENEEDAKKHIPLIESTLLRIFSQSNADDLATSAGKTSLKQKSLIEVQKTMQDVASGKVVEQVLFTGFVMQ